MAHEARDITAQLVAVKALFVHEIYDLNRETNRLRVNINKRDQYAEDNNLYQERKIKKIFRATKLFSQAEINIKAKYNR